MSLRDLWNRLRRRGGRVLAVDLDGRSLRMVLADVSGAGTRVRRVASAELPADLDPSDAAAVGGFLRRTLEAMGLSGATVVMNVPRAQAVFKPLLVPPVADESELASVVRYQAEKELAFRPDEAVIDFAREVHYGVETAPQEEAPGEHVLVAAVQRPVVEFYRRVAEAAGVRLLRLGLRPYADIRALEAFASTGPGTLVLAHLTGEEVEIDIVDRGGLVFSRSARLTTAGAGADGSVPAATVRELVRSVQSYLAVERDRRIERVLVAGGTGAEAEVAAGAGDRLGVPAAVFDPSDRLAGVEVPGPPSAFISALGLAVCQGDVAAPPFDFLDPKRPRPRRDPVRTAVTVGAAGLLVVVGAALAGGAVHLYRAGAVLAERQAQLGQLKKEAKPTLLLAKRLGQIETWVAEGRNWLDHLAYLSACFPPCQEVYATGLRTGEDGAVTLSVRARTGDAIDALADRLTKAGYAFKPGQVTTAEDKFGYGYVTAAKVIAPAAMEVDLAGLPVPRRPSDDVSATRLAEAERKERSGSASRSDRGEGGRPAEPSARPASEERRQEDRRSEDRGTAKRSPDADFRAAYERWMRERAELMRRRPDRRDERAYEAWRRQMRALYERMPRRGRSGGRGETRYPGARY